MRFSRLTVALIALVVVQNGWLLWPRFRALVLQYEIEPASRGRILAGELGCFNCHGPGGAGGVPNPGSRWQTVPGFGEQTLMMYATSDDDVRQYILDGAPEQKRADDSYREEIGAQVLRMPSYRGHISAAELEDLLAYVRSASGMFAPSDGPAHRGAQLAAANGCFHCHGDLGVGGLPNPGSLKGYIPGFVGSDFVDLVQNDEELHDWIAKGAIARLAQSALASYYLRNQRLQMPAFEKFLTSEEIADVAAYVHWLSGAPWRNQPLPH